MASLTKLTNGFRIQFHNRGGIRKPIWLGRKITERQAEAVLHHVANLETASATGQPIDRTTASWLDSISETLHGRLTKAGLCEPRIKAEAVNVVTLGMLVDRYTESRTDWKPATRLNFAQAMRWLLKHFRADIDVAAITSADAQQYRRWITSKLSVATANRNTKRAKQLFSYAVDANLLLVSPFAKVKGGKVGGSSHDRKYFVTREEIDAVLDACPDHEWRLLVALSRFGGLRIPSEAFELKWSDINWERNRMIVPVPKLEHIPGHETRAVPIFPELRPYLDAAFAEAAEGAVYVIGTHRGENLRTQLGRIIRKAGVKPWPKLWHSMRASRQTELSASFPQHVVCAWIGNSPAIAAEHYLSVTDADYERALTITSDTNSTNTNAITTATITASELAHQLAQYTRESTGTSHQEKTNPLEFSDDSSGFPTVPANQCPHKDSNLEPND